MNEFVLSKESAVVVKPDAIIVLGAGLRKMYDEIVCSAQSINNVEKGIELAVGYKDVIIVFSGGFSLSSITEATAMYKYFKEVYPEINSDTLLEIQSRNSYGNIYHCLNLAEKNGWSNIIIIDQPMHLPQLQLLARKELQRRKLQIRLQFVPAKPIWSGNVQKQWRNPFVLAIYEILSTGYYLLKGKIL